MNGRARGFVVVANAAAGGAQEEAVSTACDALAEAAAVERVDCQALEDIDGVVEAAGARTVVVAGGDGSVHALLGRAFARDPGRLRDLRVGIVPLGTGNDLARGLGLPLDPAEAAAVILRGTPRRLDLLSTDAGHVVANVAHAGLGALAAERAADLKDALGPAAYPVGALVEGVVDSGHQLRVDVDGRTVHDGLALMVGVGNASSIGGGTPLVPSADPGDGLLDVVVVRAVGRLARAAFSAALRGGQHVDRDDVDVHRGRTVTMAGDDVPHALDGELFDEPGPWTYRVEPGAWQVLVG